MKIVRLLISSLIFLAFSQLYGQRVDIGIFPGNSSYQMEVRIKPNYTESGSNYITNGRFTVKWPRSSGISIITPDYPIFPYEFQVTPGSLFSNGEYYYQRFTATGNNTISWSANSEIIVVKFSFSGASCPVFEIADDDFVSQPSVNGKYVFEIGGSSRTGIFYQAVAQRPLPGAAGTITGPSEVCQSQTGVEFSVAEISGATDYLWTYSETGAYINGTGNTVVIDFTPSATSGNLTVYGVNECGSGIASPRFPVTVSPASVGGIAVPDDSTLCYGSSTVVRLSGYSGSIQWQQSSDGITGWTNVTGGSGSNTAVYTTPGLQVDTWYRARVSNGSCTIAYSNTVLLAVYAIPLTPNSGGNKTICRNQPVPALTVTTGGGETADWYMTSSGGTPVATGSLSFTPPEKGTWYAEARNIAAGCISPSRTPLTLTINEQPTVDAGPDKVISNGTSTVISDAGALGILPLTYLWSPSSLFVNPNQLHPSTVNMTTSTLVTLTVSDNNGCSNSDQMTITVIGGSLAVIPSVTPSAVCTGNPVMLNANPTGGTGNYTYSWTSNTSGFISAEANPQVWPAMTTTYTVVVSDGHTSASGNITVTVHPNPVAPVSNGDKTICENLAFPALTVSVNAGETADWYPVLWEGSPVAVSSLSYTPAGAGTWYAMARNLTTGCVSTLRTPVSLTVNPLPSVYAGSDKSISAGNSVTISDAAASGSPSLSFSWAPAGSFLDATILNPTTVNLTSSGIYTLAVTDGKGCSNSDQLTINVSASTLAVNPSASIPVVCSGGQVYLTANASGGSGTYTYSWSSNPSGFVSSLSNPVITPQVATIYTVQVNDGFNTVTGNVTVGIHELPDSPVSGSNKTICNGQNIPTLNVSVGTGNTADWYSASSGGVALATGSIFYTPSSGGTYYAQTRNSTTGCISAFRTGVTLTIHPLPVVFAGADKTIPAGTSTTMNDASATGADPMNYLWTPSVAFEDANILNPTTENLSLTNVYTLKVTDHYGCSSSDQAAIFISGGPLSENTLAVPSAVCMGAMVYLHANASGGSGTYTYSWSSVPGNFSSTDPNPVVMPTVTTTYQVVISDGSNTVTGNVVVTVNPLTGPPASTGDKTICEGQPLPRLEVVTGTGITTDWYSVSSGGVPILINNNQFSPPSGGIWYAEARISSTGCTSPTRTPVTLTVNPIPPPPVSNGNRSVCGSESFPAMTVTTATGITADWYTSPTGGAPVAAGTLSYTPSSAGTWYVQARNITTGCTNLTRTPVTMTVYTVPSPPVSGGNKTICANQVRPALTVIAGTGETADWYSSPTGGSALVTGSLSFIPPGAGTWYACARNLTSGCVSLSRTAVTLTVNLIPDDPVSQGDRTVCSNQTNPALSVTTPSGITADWYSGAGSLLASGTLSYTPGNAGTFYAEARNTTTGCKSIDRTTVALTVHPNPPPPVSNGNITICSSQAIPALSVTTIAGVTVDWYSAAAGGSVQASGTLAYTPANGGTFYAEARNISTGCVSITRTPVSLTINPVPPAPVSGGNKNVCTNMPFPVLTVTTGSGVTADWYTSPTGGTPIAAATQSFSPTSSGTYYAEARNISSGCVSASRTPVTLTVNTLPVVYAGADKTISSGTGTTIQDATVTGVAPLLYSWTPASFFVNPALRNPTTINLTASAVFSLIATDGNGCTNSDQITITVTGTPLTVNPSASPSTVCTSGQVQLYTNATGGSGNYSYSWSSNPAGFTSSLANPIVNPSVSTTYTVQVNDGFSSVSGQLTINPYPSPPISGGNKSICAGQAFPSLTVTPGHGETADWFQVPSGGTALATGTLAYTPTSAGTFYVQARNVNAGCVSGTRTPVTLTVHSLPLVFAGSDKAIAYGTSTTVQDATASGTSPLTYSWSPQTAFVNATQLNPVTRSLTSTGSYTLTVTDGNGCSNSDQVSISVAGGALQVTPVALSPVICAGIQTQLNANASGGSGSYSYTWTSFPAGFISSQPNPTISPSLTTIYTIQVNDGYNSVSGSVTVTVNTRPSAPISNGNKTICMGEPYPSLSVSTGLGETADWFASATGGTALATGTLVYTPAMAGTYYAQARNTGNGCTSESRTAVILTVNPVPESPVSIGDKMICSGQPVPVLSVSTPEGVTTDWFTTATGGTAVVSGMLSFTPDGAGLFYAQSRNITTGCTNHARTPVSLTVYPLPVAYAGADREIPNGTSVTFNDATASGEMPLAFSWSPSDQIINASILNAVTKNLTAQANFTLTVTDGNHCSNSDLVAVSVRGTPLTVNPSASPSAVCPGSPVQLVANVSGGSGDYTYSWISTPSGFQSSQPNPTVIPSGTTVYTLLVTDGFSEKSGSVTVAVYPAPNAPISGGNKTICAEEPVPALTVNVGPGETADWYPSSAGTYILATGTLGYTPPGAGPWYAQARNTTTGCVSTVRTAVYLNVNPTPEAPVTLGNKAICSNQTIPAMSVAVPQGVTVDWYNSPVGGTLLKSASAEYTPSTADTFYAEARHIPSGCVSRTRTPVILAIHPNPDVPLSQGDVTICAGQLLPGLKVTTGNGVTADWYDSPDADTALVSGTLVYNPVSSGIYYAGARNIVTGCTSTMRVPISLTVMPVPSVFAGADRNIPFGTSVILHDATASGEAPLSFSWSPVSAFHDNTLLHPATVNLTATDIYTLTVTDKNQCSNGDQVTITITGGPLSVNPSISSSTVCAGSAVQINAQASGGSGSYTYAWTTMPAGFSSDQAGFTVTPTVTTVYAVTVSDGFNQASGQVTVTVHPAPLPPVSQGDQTICADQPISEMKVTVGEGEVADWHLVSSGIPDPATGTFVYFWKSYARNLATGCRSILPAEVTLTIHPNPAPPVSKGNVKVCSGESYPALSVTTGTGLTADWYSSSTGGIAAASGTLDFIPPAVGTWYAESRNPETGCVSKTRTPVEMTVHNRPVVYAGADRNVPYGTHVVINDAVASGLQPLTWIWSPAALFADATVLTPSTLAITGTSTCTLTVTDGNNCSSSDQMTITITGSKLSANPTTSYTLVCEGSPVEIKANASGGSGYYSYSWRSEPAGFASTEANPVVTPYVNTTYFIRVNDGFASLDRSVSIEVIPGPPAPSGGSNQTICPGTALPALTVTTSPGVTVDWYGSSSGGAPLVSGSHSFVPPGAGTWYAQSRNTGNGCFSVLRTPVSLNLHPSPAPPVSAGDQSICEGQSIPGLKATAGTGETIDWYSQPSGGVAVAAGTDTFLPRNQGTWYAGARNLTTGCVSQTRTAITFSVHPLPTLFPGTDRNIPYGTYTTIGDATASGTPPLITAWTPSTSFIDASKLNPVTRSLTATGIYTLTVTDGNNCRNSGQITIFVTGSPLTVSLTAFPPVIGTSQLTQLIPNASGGSGNYTYAWSSDPPGFISTVANPVVRPEVTTVYTVRVSDGFNTATGNVTVIVNPFPSAPVSGGNVTVCAGDNIPPLSVSTASGETADWYSAPSGGTVLASGTLQYVPPAPGSYYAEARNTTTGAISNSRTQVILTLAERPVVKAGPDLTICSHQTTLITGASADHATSLSWFTEGKGIFNGIQTINPEYTPAQGEYGHIRFILSASGTGVCGGTTVRDTMTIRFPVPLVVETGKDTVVLAGTTAVLSARVSGGPGDYLYQWSPGSMVVHNTFAITETVPLSSGTQFLVRVTDAATGCFSEKSFQVTVEKSIDDMLVITNGITPNGDGNNDVWKIKGIEFFPDNEVVILNRWGDRIKMLQHYDNVNVFWDGSNEHGKPVPDGTYFYTLNIRGRKNFKGWIQLKRSL